jgi:hypothetical protein
MRGRNPRQIVAALAALLAAAAAAGAAAPPAGRAAKVAQVAAKLEAEVREHSPALRKAVDWQRVRIVLRNAGAAPSLALARGVLLCEAYHLDDWPWPVGERLALLRVYVRDDSVAVRRLAVDLLGRQDAVKAGSLADLRRVSEADADPQVKVFAARRLLEFEDPAGWRPLLALLHSDDPEVRKQPAVQAPANRAAKNALIELSRRRWGFYDNAARLPEALRLTPELVALAGRAFEMRDNVIRRTVYDLIGLSRDRRFYGLLRQRLEAEQAWTCLRSLFISLGYVGDPRAVPLMAAGIAKPKVNRAGRLSPSLGLAFLGRVEGLRALVDALADGQHLTVLAQALSRAFDPGFDAGGGLFLVPDADGRLVGRWIPDASTGAAPMRTDRTGRKVRARALSAKQVHAAWDAFLTKYGPKLEWDGKTCSFRRPVRQTAPTRS